MEEQKFNLMKIAAKLKKYLDEDRLWAHPRCDADECIPGNPLRLSHGTRTAGGSSS